MKLTAKDKKITRDVLSRLLLVEEIKGEDVRVKIKSSAIAIKKDDDINVSLEIDTDDEEQDKNIREFFGVGPKAFMSKNKNFKELAMTLSAIEPGGDYLIGQPALILKRMTIIADDDEVLEVGHGNLPDLAGFFGLMANPVFQPPACMIVALQEKDEVALKGVCNSIKNRKSLYGKHNFQPNFYVTPGIYVNSEERELKWYIK